MKKILALSLLMLVSTLSYSEDIELYISQAVKLAAKKTQVLIIFDNSGSMRREETVKLRYDPTENYPALPGRTKFSKSYIYYNKGDEIPIPDKSDENRRFETSLNGCESAKNALNTLGFYTGHVRRYKFKDNTGQWKNLNRTNGSNIYVLDCEDDVVNGEASNASGVEDGYPVNFLGNKTTPQYYTDDLAASNVEWSGALITLYSENYLRWHLGDSAKEEKRTRIDMARQSINDVIKAAPSIDFGLQVFNYDSGDSNTSENGGRIVFGISEMTDANEAAYLDLVNNEIFAQGNTPLCETLYEASLYFSGKNVDYGDDDKDKGTYYDGNKPPRDLTIESSGKYITPFSSCSSKAYVILITDGVPTQDKHADSKIEGLTALEDGETVTFSGSRYDNNYLAGLAEWMSNRDLNGSLEGKQTSDLYTIGFSAGADDAAPLLKEAARLGGGKYFRAEDSAQLTAALIGALEDLEPSNDSLTSASVASNNFDRTETLNSVYYAMFQPDNGPRWQGNLKKYKVINGEQVGKHGKTALNKDSGHFSEDVTSFWSDESSKDGNVVAEGGVADMLRKKSSRVIYSDIGTSGALALLTETQAATSFGGLDKLASEIGVVESKVSEALDWAKGKNVDGEKLDDGTIPAIRPDVFGDPLHSKPLVINYGSSVRILIGTNAGVLHMFEDKGDTVDENWAFMPKEFFSNIQPLRENFATADKVYGIDGAITSYVNDKNGDGLINGSDEVWVFFGLRRGGSSYYALDVSNPAAPSKLWHIDASTAKFSQLGQSWSQPKVGYSKLNVSGTGESAVAKPVIFFGGGYDVNKDASGPRTNDSKGKAIYMVDAKSGTQKWSMLTTGGDTTYSGTDGIASSIGLLDGDGDGLVDRLYTGDTGGNIWRVDMPSDDPDDSDDPWTVFKLADLGGSTNGNDIRFFNEPSIVRTFISETIETKEKDEDGKEVTITSHHEKPYDAVLIGSGDRTNPIGRDTADTFFMIKDPHIKTQSFYSAKSPTYPTTITKSELYDYSDDPFSKADTTLKRQTLSIAVSKKSGWYIDLSASGEKSTAEAIVINGIVYFTTFIPPNLTPGTVHCVPPNGTGLLYAVDLSLGTAIYNWNNSETDGVPDAPERSTTISEQFLGAPTLIVVPTSDGDDTTVDKAVGNIIVGRKIIPVGFSLQTMRTYLYVGEE